MSAASNHDHGDHAQAHGHSPSNAEQNDGGDHPAADALAKKVFLSTVLGAVAYIGVVILFVLMGKL